MRGFQQRTTWVAVIALALGSVALSAGVRAQPLTMQEYQHPKTAKDLVYNKTYMIGVADGLIAYNMSADVKLFCLPGIIPHLSFDQANDLAIRWARTADSAADLPVGRALLFGLQKAHRCPR